MNWLAPGVKCLGESKNGLSRVNLPVEFGENCQKKNPCLTRAGQPAWR